MAYGARTFDARVKSSDHDRRRRDGQVALVLGPTCADPMRDRLVRLPVPRHGRDLVQAQEEDVVAGVQNTGLAQGIHGGRSGSIVAVGVDVIRAQRVDQENNNIGIPWRLDNWLRGRFAPLSTTGRQEQRK